MKLVVLSRREALHFECSAPWACISISDDENFPDIGGENFVEVLRLNFHDISSKYTYEPELLKEAGYILFNESHAKQILAFINSEEVGGVDTLMIHCAAGISRSAATAAAIAKTLGMDYQYYFTCGKFIPNRHVFNTILGIAERERSEL